jgi:hypothetical protein
MHFNGEEEWSFYERRDHVDFDMEDLTAEGMGSTEIDWESQDYE